ncbi:unnamed protein product [Larinioides sclopetarius]|uniref:Bestrophin homolog n=2 Tax=Entelegynae TaxID=74971 RepID=A0AAV1YW93_9ARAC
MHFLEKFKRVDLVSFAEEFGIEITSQDRVSDICAKIKADPDYDEEFAEIRLNFLVADRVEKCAREFELQQLRITYAVKNAILNSTRSDGNRNRRKNEPINSEFGRNATKAAIIDAHLENKSYLLGNCSHELIGDARRTPTVHAAVTETESFEERPEKSENTPRNEEPLVLVEGTLPEKELPWADKESDPSLKISSREMGEIQKTCIAIRETVVQIERGNKPTGEPLSLGSPRKTVPFDTQGKGDAPSSRLELKEKRDLMLVNKEIGGSEQLNLKNRLESNVRKIEVQLSGHQYNVGEAEELKNIRQNSNEKIKSQIEAPIEDLSDKLPCVSYFEKVSLYCKTYGDLIPVSFILGFYVSIVVKRWWDSFNCIPWPDTLAFFVSAYVHGQDERGRLMRRTIMRYANLAFVITLTCISPCVKKRFPTMDHLVDAGILLPNEKKIMEQLKTSHSTYWMPLVWASSIAIRARKEGRVRDDFALNTLVEAIANYRMLCGGLFNYDWISIPLVYTQVVTLVVYTFFLATLMGRQYLDPTQGHPGYDVDLYIPIFNFLQFFFYMGWLKVAETLVNPFGEDDDDFEVNWVIDRDIQVSYLIVDEMHQEHPELIKDQYWDEVMPDLPYTAAAMPFYSEPPMGSAANLVIPPHEAEFVPLETLEENEDELDGVKVINGIPCETSSNNRSRLNSHLSGSAYSGISKLGRSFHPMSYERKGILNLMQDFLSRESSVRKKKLWKAPSKDSTVDQTGSCETSGPPTPDEFKDRSGLFNDDIFHLSDLSLADSRGNLGSTGTGSGMHSPGYYSNMPVEDIFWQKRSKPSRYLQRSASKVSTPQSEAPHDSTLRLPTVMRKKSTNSLKQFFRSGKYRGSQKSLIGSVQGRSRSKLTLKGENSKDTDSITASKYALNDDDKNSLSDEDITVREAYPNPDDMSKSTTNIDDEVSPGMSAPISFSRPRNSLPQELEYSPDKSSLGKLAKESSTSTLVPTEGSLESTPPTENPSSPVEKPNIVQNPEHDETFKSIENIDLNVDNSSLNGNIKSNPSLSKPTYVSIPQKNVFTKFRPKRAASLHINEYHKDVDSPGMSGLQKFFDRHRSHKFLRTMSQPVSPTGSEAPVLKHKGSSSRGLFSRRPSNDKPNKSSSTLQLGNDSEVSQSQSLVEQKNLKNLASKSADV